MNVLDIKDMDNSLFEYSATVNNLAYEIQSKMGRSVCRV